MNNQPPHIPFTYFVNIFAHNEELIIAQAIEAVLAQKIGAGEKLELHIFANGCSDKTEEIVRQYEAKDNRVKLHALKVKGKVKALKEAISYYHQRGLNENDLLFNLDADITFEQPNCFELLKTKLATDPDLFVVSSYPAPSSYFDQRRDFVAQLFNIRYELHKAFAVNTIRGACYVIKWNKLVQVDFPDDLISDDMYLECALAGHFLMDYENIVITEIKENLQKEIARDLFHRIAAEQVYHKNRTGLIKRIDKETARDQFRLTHQEPKKYLSYLLGKFKISPLFIMLYWSFVSRKNKKKAHQIFFDSLESKLDLISYWSTIR